MAAATASTAAAAAAFFLVVVVVMVTVDAGGLQLALQIGLNGCVCVALRAGADLDTGGGEGGLCAVTDAAADFSVSITYELLNAPRDYVSIRTDITVSENGQAETYPRAQVFLLDNGWKLSLETLLGDNYEKAAPMLLGDILEWCGDSGIQVTGSADRTLEEFSENYALTREGFLFYVEPFALNNKNANRYAIPVDLDDYIGMMEN